MGKEIQGGENPPILKKTLVAAVPGRSGIQGTTEKGEPLHTLAFQQPGAVYFREPLLLPLQGQALRAGLGAGARLPRGGHRAASAPATLAALGAGQGERRDAPSPSYREASGSRRDSAARRPRGVTAGAAPAPPPGSAPGPPRPPPREPAADAPELLMRGWGSTCRALETSPASPLSRTRPTSR